MDRSAIYGFLLVIHSNHWACLVPFPRQTAISVENRNFFPCGLMPQLREFPLGVFKQRWQSKKLRLRPYQKVEKVRCYADSLTRTDGQTELVKHAYMLLYMPLHVCTDVESIVGLLWSTGAILAECPF